MKTRCSVHAAWALPCALLVAFAAPLCAQRSVDFADGSNWTVGYVVNAPHQLLGFGTGLVLPALRGWGVYSDVKLTTGAPSGQSLLDLTPAEAEATGDDLFRQESTWRTVNVAAVRGITRELALYLGGGASWETVYFNYVDPQGERGRLGRYWVEDVAASRIHPNVIAGAFFRMGNRFVFQFGAEGAPAGFTAGGHLLLR